MASLKLWNPTTGQYEYVTAVGMAPGPLIYTQATPSTTWVLPGVGPSNIVVVNDLGEVILPGTTTFSGATATIGFSVPVSGKAYCFR